MSLSTNAEQVTAWKKPLDAPDYAYERLGDFADIASAMHYVRTELMDCQHEYTYVPVFVDDSRMRTPLPSELPFLLRYHGAFQN